MSVADAIIALLDSQINTIPLSQSNTDDSAIHFLLTLLDDPPIGVTQYKLKYFDIPLHRSGPKGWTYFPATTDGTRVAKVSYKSPKPNIYVTALVKLTNYETDAHTETYTVAEYAIVTIDNLGSYGKVEMRDNYNTSNKRLKIVHQS